jgi:ubiquinone biosynthesis protein
LDRRTAHPQRVMVATDGSQTAERAVEWAARFADRFGADLHLIRVITVVQDGEPDFGSPERVQTATDNLVKHARSVAGDRGRGRVVVSDDPAMAIVRAAESDAVDVLVVGNAGMAGRKEFLLGNVPNRISHNACCTVIIVNTIGSQSDAAPALVEEHYSQNPGSPPYRAARVATIAAVFAKHGLRELFALAAGDGGDVGRRAYARRLRTALEELGPAFAKIGQLLSTRPDLLPPEFIEELATLQDHVTPLTEEQVVRVMEQELGVPWEDVFESVEPQPLACGTIGQVHRATLTGGDKVVLKVQRPEAQQVVTEDLALLQLFVEQLGSRPGVRQLVDAPSIFKHLSTSLKGELDFRLEARSAERMREAVADFPRLSVPVIYANLSTSRLLVMQDVGGTPPAAVPEGPLRHEVARQLVESFCKQILIHGFLHADPHPGNFMWQPAEQRLYFLDLGSVDEIDSDIRELMVFVLTSFWQGDSQFLSDVVLTLSERTGREPDFEAFRQDIAQVVANHRGASLKNIQLGTVLLEITQVAFRRGVVLPGSLTLTAKALGQMQVVVSQLDPSLDPFEVAGRFLMRRLMRQIAAASDPKTLFYEFQKLKFRTVRLFDALERLVGAQPGPKADFSFRAASLERTVARASRRLALGLIAGFNVLATALTSVSGHVPIWVSIVFAFVGAGFLLGLLVDLLHANGRTNP